MISGFDHVAITVADLDVTCAFYVDLLGADGVESHAWNGVPDAVRRVMIGGALLSIHRQGNGVDLVARVPTPGSADLCFRWTGTIEAAEGLLQAKSVPIVAGPVPRTANDGKHGASVYFHDPDGNPIELLAA